MDTMTTLKKWQDEYFTLVQRVEKPVVRFVGERAEAVARFVPERPEFMAALPKMTTLVDTQLKFSKRFVDEQAAFVRSMMKAMHPMMVKLDAMPEPVVKVQVKVQAKAKQPTARSASRRMTHKAA